MKKIKLLMSVTLFTTLLLCVACQSKSQTTLSLDSGFLRTMPIRFGNDIPDKDTTKWKDTIAVVLLVCDTLNIHSSVYWIKAYSVRDAEYELVDVSVDPNTKTYLGGGVYSTTLLGWSPIWKNKPVYSHAEYLDNKKTTLPKSVIVWQSVSK